MKLVSMTFRIPKKVKIAFCVILALLTVSFVGFTFYKSFVVPPEMTENKLIDDDFIGPMPLGLEKTGDVYTFLLAGRDSAGLNTDTMMVVSFDTTEYTINIMSIPRDTMSANVTRTTKKINAAYGVGGTENPDQLLKEVEQIIGIHIDRYMIVNLDVLIEAVDILGGIEIDVEHNMYYTDDYQDLTISISAGLQTLTGEQAMGYVRYRSNYAEGDLRRIENQMTFIKAVADKVLTPTIVTKIPSLISSIIENVDTNFSIGEIAWLALEALNVDLENDLNSYVLPGYGGYAYELSYYFVYGNQLLELLNESFNPYVEALTLSDLKIQTKAPEDSQITVDDEDRDEEFDDEIENEEVDDDETSTNTGTTNGSTSSGSSSGSNSSGSSSGSSGTSTEDSKDDDIDEEVYDDTDEETTQDESAESTGNSGITDDGSVNDDATYTEDGENSSGTTAGPQIDTGDYVNPEEIRPES